MKITVEMKRWDLKNNPTSIEWTFYLAYLACQHRILQHTNDLFIQWWNKHRSPITHNSDGSSSDNMAVVIIAFIEKGRHDLDAFFAKGFRWSVWQKQISGRYLNSKALWEFLALIIFVLLAAVCFVLLLIVSRSWALCPIFC